jgi:hypothetical protein
LIGADGSGLLLAPIPTVQVSIWRSSCSVSRAHFRSLERLHWVLDRPLGLARSRPQLLLLQTVSLGQHCHCHCGVDGSLTFSACRFSCISALSLHAPSLVYVIPEKGVGLVLCLMGRVGVVWCWWLLLLLLLCLLCLLVCFPLLGDMQLLTHCLALCLLRPASSWFVLNLFWVGSVRVR